MSRFSDSKGTRAFVATRRVTYRSGRWRGTIALGSETVVASDKAEVTAWADRLFSNRWAAVQQEWNLDDVKDVDIHVSVRQTVGVVD